MRAILRLLIVFIAITVMRSGALRQNDAGVCTKRETTVVMQTETFMSSYAARYRTCSLWVFCSTNYRTAYRSSSRSVYRTIETDILTCCHGYVEVEDECKSKAPVTTPPSSPPISSPAITSFSTSYFSLSKEHSTKAFFTTFSNFPVENKPLPLAMTMMLSGVVIIFTVVGVSALVLIIFVLYRKKRESVRAASSPLHREESRNGRGPQVQYYAVIPESTTESSGVVICASPLNPSPSTVYKQSTKKKKPLSHVPLSIKKLSKGEKMLIDSNQDERDVSNKLLPEDLSHYTDMNSPKETSTSIVGYTDMRSPTSGNVHNMRCTYMSQDSERYSEMNTQEHSAEAVPQSSEGETYDELNLAKRLSIENNCYDKLDRSNDLLWGSTLTNNYDHTGQISDEDNEVREEINAHCNQENLYDHTENKCLLDSGREHDNLRETHYINSHCQESDPTYYNSNSGDQLPAGCNDVSIYTNVS